MGISVPRMVLGGLVAGLVINLGELAVNVFWLGSAWSGALAQLGLEVAVGDLVVWGIGSFVLGIVGVWIYVAAWPRYGPGAWTALRAGFALWVATFVYAGIGINLSKLFDELGHEHVGTFFRYYQPPYTDIQIRKRLSRN